MSEPLAGGHDILTEEVEEASPRSFGLTFAVVFAIYGLWPLWSGQPIRLWAIGTTVALVAVSIIRPAVLAVPSRLWMKVGLVLHHIVNPIVMGVLFYGVVTPFAAFWRWRNPTQTANFRPDPAASSYWTARADTPTSMQRQF